MTSVVDRLVARRLAIIAARHYFESDIDATFYPDNLTAKRSSSVPKHQSDIWARLLTEAIISFNQGLEDRIDPEDRRASNDLALYNQAKALVGDEAFNVIAYLVATAGIEAQRRTFDDLPDVEQKLQQLEKQMGGVDPVSLVQSEIDRKVIGPASSLLVNEWNFLDNQGEVQSAAQKMQQFSATQGLSPELARFLGQKGAYYQILADALTRQSTTFTQPTQERGVFYEGQ